MAIEYLFEGQPEADPGPVRAPSGWLTSLEVAPVALVTLVGGCLPVVAEILRIPIVRTFGDFWVIGWAFAWFLVIALWLVFLAGAFSGIVASIASRRFGWTAVIAVIVIACPAAAVRVYGDEGLRAKVYYGLHRSDFERIRAYAHGGTVQALAADDTKGAALPAELAGYSSTGRIYSYRADGDAPSFLVPIALGWNRGAMGFAYSRNGPPRASGAQAGGYPDQTTPVAELGDGWWWVEAA